MLARLKPKENEKPPSGWIDISVLISNHPPLQMIVQNSCQMSEIKECFEKETKLNVSNLNILHFGRLAKNNDTPKSLKLLPNEYLMLKTQEETARFHQDPRDFDEVAQNNEWTEFRVLLGHDAHGQAYGKLMPNIPFKDLKIEIGQKINRDKDTLTFTYRGREIQDTDTVVTMKMVNFADIIVENTVNSPPLTKKVKVKRTIEMDDGEMTIQVLGWKFIELRVKVKWDLKMVDLKKCLANHTEIPVERLCLARDGRQIRMDDTPRTLQMVDGEMLYMEDLRDIEHMQSQRAKFFFGFRICDLL